MAETDFDFGQATAATFLGMALTPWPANVSRGFNCFLLTMAAAALLVGWFATHVPPPTAEHPQIYIGLNPQMASVFFHIFRRAENNPFDPRCWLRTR